MLALYCIGACGQANNTVWEELFVFPQDWQYAFTCAYIFPVHSLPPDVLVADRPHTLLLVNSYP